MGGWNNGAGAGDEEQLSTGQTAHRLGLSTQHVRNLIETKQLEAKPTPLGWLVSAESVDRLARERQGKKGGRGR